MEIGTYNNNYVYYLNFMRINLKRKTMLLTMLQLKTYIFTNIKNYYYSKGIMLIKYLSNIIYLLHLKDCSCYFCCY